MVYIDLYLFIHVIMTHSLNNNFKYLFKDFECVSKIFEDLILTDRSSNLVACSTAHLL